MNVTPSRCVQDYLGTKRRWGRMRERVWAASLSRVGLALAVLASVLAGCKQRSADNEERYRSAAEAPPAALSSLSNGGGPSGIADERPCSGRTTRESKRVAIDGQEETWTLEWLSGPEPTCRESSINCPCEGFAYGETGRLVLVRRRGGSEVERMNLSDLFVDGLAILPRWAPAVGDVAGEPSSEVLASRPLVEIMKFGDYDRDGRATEFPLQIRATSCHTQTVLIGISKTLPTLHVIGTKQTPDKGLLLEHFEDWEKVLAAPKVSIIQWECGDHGAPQEMSLEIRAAHGMLSARTIVRRCSVEEQR